MCLRVVMRIGNVRYRHQKRQLTREIRRRFHCHREAVKREVERRVKERMILSRNRAITAALPQLPQ